MGHFRDKRIIFNDPIYEFVTIPYKSVYDLIQHPYFQRLRRIRQLGLTHLVYPGALHTRFHHAIGSMHLVMRAVEVLKSKGHKITEEETEGVALAILLHDIGHGPFSHALENSIVFGIGHEDLSSLFMERLNKNFKNRLSVAIAIFNNEYPKKYLHQLVSSQLDMDRMDYLKRDSFYAGVSEGVVGAERIIKMLDVHDDQLVVEAKGIYSVENFIVARRLMYLQVYLHKTVIAAEELLIKILKRARVLAGQGVELFATPALRFFLYAQHTKNDFLLREEVLEQFATLDDYDIFTSVKVWQSHSDKVLSTLCGNMVNRTLYKIEISDKPFGHSRVEALKEKYGASLGIDVSESDYFVFTGNFINDAYNPLKDKILIKEKDGRIIDLADATDQLSITVLSKMVKKHYLCYPGE